ncbi:hypothetical protein TWF696_004573 [Orbilia brochopaga]|uniref:HNH nuclease domain-containing protein n=1 Tax=Orbilia brochopaga TaxID=3140254 RepID=A0AAV9V6P3_9PEZI
MESLISPFQPLRHRHPVICAKVLNKLEETPGICREDALALHSLIWFTTNEALFRGFSSLSVDQLNDLGKLTQIGLRNLRNYEGRPAATIETPKITPVQSPMTSPMPASQSSPTSSPASTPVSDLGLAIIEHLGIKVPLPTLPGGRRATSAKYESNCRSRQQALCAITGIDMEDYDETAQPFPHSSLQLKSISNIITWRFISILLGEELRDMLAKELFTESEGIHTTANGLWVDSAIRRRYDTGNFVLLPIQRPKDDPYYFDAEYVCHSSKNGMKHLQTYLPLDPEYQCRFDVEGNPIRMNLGSPRTLEGGNIIRLSTTDPAQFPLPSPTLLFWHDYLWKVLGFAGLQGPRSRYDGRLSNSEKDTTRRPGKRGLGTSPSGSRTGSARGSDSDGSDHGKDVSGPLNSGVDGSYDDHEDPDIEIDRHLDDEFESDDERNDDDDDDEDAIHKEAMTNGAQSKLSPEFYAWYMEAEQRFIEDVEKFNARCGYKG